MKLGFICVTDTKPGVQKKKILLQAVRRKDKKSQKKTRTTSPYNISAASTYKVSEKKNAGEGGVLYRA